jgi:hypothetical protein
MKISPVTSPSIGAVTSAAPINRTIQAPEIDKPDQDVQSKPAVEAPTQPISPQLAELARQRRALQVERREFEAAKKAQEAEGASRSSERATLEARLKEKPWSTLQELGVTSEYLTQDIISHGKEVNPEVRALEAKIKELESNVDKKLADKDSAQEQAVFAHMRRNIDEMARSNPAFKFIKESGSQGDVLEIIRQTWKQHGESLDEEEVMKEVESELRKDAKKYADLIKELEPGTAAPALQPQPQPEQGIRTLTNKDSARPAISRKQRAIAAMLGQR